MKKTAIIKLLGTIGTISAFLMFTSLLEVAQSNLSGRSDIYIQPLVTALSCSIWSLYAYLSKERFVLLANIPGVILGLLTTISAFI